MGIIFEDDRIQSDFDNLSTSPINDNVIR